ncbi:MAG: hypothetical protein A2Y95_02795 [Deltaproteobacteria bacterium RBG_13_65_10]|nr:MAG: hypothetical protein A2Y95_02795 [Deltaproteobacteria bacterium RBG_13_65_10]
MGRKKGSWVALKMIEDGGCWRRRSSRAQYGGLRAIQHLLQIEPTDGYLSGTEVDAGAGAARAREGRGHRGVSMSPLELTYDQRKPGVEIRS